MEEKQPLLTICCVTYNHEKYISQTLDGFLIQKTSFPIEIIVHDDASTDKTANIIKLYCKKDNRIIPILREKNIKSTGVSIFPLLFKMSKGKYIAMCEGDDYWTDPYKLQKQVDFLEKNSDFILTSHRVEVINGENKHIKYSINFEKDFFNIEDLSNGNFMYTHSVVFKNILCDEYFNYICHCGIGDYPTYIYLAQFGKIKILNEIMGVYRLHNEGIWSKTIFIKKWNLLNNFYEATINYFISKEKYNIVENIKKQYIENLINFFKYSNKFDMKEVDQIINKNNDYNFYKQIINILIERLTITENQKEIITNSTSYKIIQKLLNPLKILKRKF